MSRFGDKVIRHHLGKIVKRAKRWRRVGKIINKGKYVKSINYARPTDGGIMFT